MKNNFLFNVDAYQTGMFKQIPAGMKDFQCSQLTHRAPYNTEEDRIVSAGLSMFVNWLNEVNVTQNDINEADEFYKDFQASVTGQWKPYPWPKEMFQTIVDKYDGKIPVYIAGLPDGAAHYYGEPSVTVWTDQKGMGECVGWLESEILPYVWQSSVVATRGRIRKENFFNVYKSIYPSMNNEEIYSMILYKFHDFGRRGAANSLITGVAHLMNWPGTDTIDSAVYAKKYLNNNQHFGACSIPAMAHRTVTPWPSEFDAYDNMIQQHGDDLVSIVADSYDYFKGATYLAEQAHIFKEKGGVLVLRPDSGDPIECIIYGLKELERNFGSINQEVGLKIINGAAMIQGDGVCDEDIFDHIIPAIMDAGYCPSNVAFGMGQHNHKATRSILESAYKTCEVGYYNKGELDYINVFKQSNSEFKKTLIGPHHIIRSSSNIENRLKPLSLFSFDLNIFNGESSQFVIQYAFGENKQWCVKPLFSEIMNNTLTSWNILPQKRIQKS